MVEEQSPQDLGALSELARALAHPHRIALLECLAGEECTVERLAGLTGLSLANASQHLQQLRRAGFADARRDGKHVLYRMGNGPVAELMDALRRYSAFRLEEMRKTVSDSLHYPDNMDGVSRDELLRMLKDDCVTLLDVRPKEEFADGHLPGAVNIPLKALEQRLSELPKDQLIVAYCRGPYCVLSTQALAALQAKGIKARRLADGFPEWKKAGLPIEKPA